MYTRPTVELPEFRDPDGNVISYGERWGMESPPEDTYEVVSHPERFAPLHQVAEVLIAHLVETYDCTVAEGPEYVADLVYPREDFTRAVRVTPASTDAAPLTFVFTNFPGIDVHAGALLDEHFPSCGCDACDETWESCAESLEELVTAVVSGGFAEEVTLRRRLSVKSSLTYPNGSRSGEGDPGPIPTARLRDAATRLAALPNGWTPWPSLT